jgi:hypothetical protein
MIIISSLELDLIAMVTFEKEKSCWAVCTVFIVLHTVLLSFVSWKFSTPESIASHPGYVIAATCSPQNRQDTIVSIQLTVPV